MTKVGAFQIKSGPGALQFGRWLPWPWVCSGVESLDWCALWPLTLITEHWSTRSLCTNAGGPGSVLQRESFSLYWSLCWLLWSQSSFLTKWKIFFVIVSALIATEWNKKNGQTFNVVKSQLLLKSHMLLGLMWLWRCAQKLLQFEKTHTYFCFCYQEAFISTK